MTEKLPFANPDEVGMSDEGLKRITPMIRNYIDQELIPGAVSMVARHGKIVHFDVQGYQNVEKQIPMTKNTIFRMASMTKPITSVALMMLYERGRFLLRDPISKWLPGFEDMQVAVVQEAGAYEMIPAVRPIEVWHILTHTAGFATQYNPKNLELIEKADAALYTAKHKGRNCVVRWDQVNGDEKAVEPKTQDFCELQTKISSLTRQLRSQTMGTVSALEKAMSIVIKDPYLEHHAKHVQLYSVAIAEEMNLSTELKEQIGTAALLHDVGKMGMPNYIFSKTTSLTQEERNIVKQHPAASTEILAPIGVFCFTFRPLVETARYWLHSPPAF